MMEVRGKEEWLAGRLGMVLAKLTKDMTSRMVSAYNFLERGCGGGRFSDLGGQGGGALVAVWGGGSGGFGRGMGRFVSRTAGGFQGLGGLLGNIHSHPREEGASVGLVVMGQGVPTTLTTD
jgi:hypothetical protein